MWAQFGTPDSACKGGEQLGLICPHAYGRAGLCSDSFAVSVAGEETSKIAVGLEWPGENEEK